MLSWLQPFLGGGRLVIHVMDSLDSLAAAAECKPPLAAEAEQWHRLNGRVDAGFEPKLGTSRAAGTPRPTGDGDGGSAGGCREQHECQTCYFPRCNDAVQHPVLPSPCRRGWRGVGAGMSHGSCCLCPAADRPGVSPSRLGGTEGQEDRGTGSGSGSAAGRGGNLIPAAVTLGSRGCFQRDLRDRQHLSLFASMEG